MVSILRFVLLNVTGLVFAVRICNRKSNTVLKINSTAHFFTTVRIVGSTDSRKGIALMKSTMATLSLKEMENFLWEDREKGQPCWLSQFSKTKLRQQTGQNFFPTFSK